MISRDTVMFALACHIGQANGVRARDLVVEICGGVPSAYLERRLRGAIEELRLEGKPICGTPGTGYFIAQDEEELKRSTTFMAVRAAKSLKQIAAMLRVSVPVLMGQLRLPS